MLKWLTPIVGLIILALGIIVFLEGKGSQEIVGIVITATSVIVILVSIGLLLKKMVKTRKSAPATPKPEEEPPIF